MCICIKAKNGIEGEWELPLATTYNTFKIVTVRHVLLASQLHYIIAVYKIDASSIMDGTNLRL